MNKPILHYTFDEGQGNIVRSKINSFDATVTNATFVKGKNGKALNFPNGSSASYVQSNVEMTGNLKLLESISFSLWYKPVKNPAVYPYIFRQRGGTWDADTQFFAIHEVNTSCSWTIVPNNISVSPVYNGYYRLFTGSNAFNIGQWNHFVGTFNHLTGILKIFINGVLKTSTIKTPAGLVNKERKLLIGGDSGNTQDVEADIDDVRMYDVELSQEEVTWLYNNGNGRTESFPKEKSQGGLGISKLRKRGQLI